MFKDVLNFPPLIFFFFCMITNVCKIVAQLAILNENWHSLGKQTHSHTPNQSHWLSQTLWLCEHFKNIIQPFLYYYYFYCFYWYTILELSFIFVISVVACGYTNFSLYLMNKQQTHYPNKGLWNCYRKEYWFKFYDPKKMCRDLILTEKEK